MKYMHIPLISLMMLNSISFTSKCMELETTPKSEKHQTLNERLFRAPDDVLLAITIHLQDPTKNNLLALKPESLEPNNSEEISQQEAESNDLVVISNAVILDFSNGALCNALYHIAIQRNHPDLVKALMAGYGIKTSFFYSTGNEFHEIAKEAFIYGREEIWNDLIQFFRSGREQIRTAALDAFISLVTQGEVRIAEKLLSHEGAKSLLLENPRYTILHFAAQHKINSNLNPEFKKLLELKYQDDCTCIIL